MKTLQFIIVLTFLTMSFINCIAQSTYRVIAVKKGDTSITSVSNEASVPTPIKLWIPTAFTPNNDGLNDSFGARGMGIENYSLEIYNRWGELLFESTDISKQWDGWYKGNPAPIDEYVYSITATGNKGTKREHITKTGSIFLLK